MNFQELQRWLSCEEHFLLLHRTRVCFLDPPPDRSQLSVTSLPRESAVLFWLPQVINEYGALIFLQVKHS